SCLGWEENWTQCEAGRKHVSGDKQDRARRAGAHFAHQALCHAWSGMVLVQSQQDRFHCVAGSHGFFMGLEAVAEGPRLVVKRRIVPGQACNPSVTQNEKVLLACAWQPALGGACVLFLAWLDHSMRSALQDGQCQQRCMPLHSFSSIDHTIL